MKRTETHIYFWGSEFSNFHPCVFMYKGIQFANSEQAFMWEKAKFFGHDDIAVQILNAESPKACKFLGRSIPNFDSDAWMKVAYDFMVAINYEKYSQNMILQAILEDTEGLTLVEGSPVDVIWGVGLKYDDPNILDESKWNGMNLLGKALMEVREKIFKSYEDA